MSSKLFKQISQQASALDEIRESSSKSKITHKVPKLDATKEEPKSVLQAQVDSFLFYDTAFSNRTDHVHKSLQRRQKSLDTEKKRLKRIKSKGVQIGNSRSSSSANARKANLPTFNKKKHMKEKKIKDLQHLAKMLRKNKK